MVITRKVAARIMCLGFFYDFTSFEWWQMTRGNDLFAYLFHSFPIRLEIIQKIVTIDRNNYEITIYYFLMTNS